MPAACVECIKDALHNRGGHGRTFARRARSDIDISAWRQPADKGVAGIDGVIEKEWFHFF
ncbi:MAG: hypothetical protein COS92_01850 [Desulfobacterales bacterium CG07_land_8_20_14_0_80_52_14]|nr:MAG: hypothetical protein COS92_01850 [Desulfobacterales bacterium CG07_land_8_20_14_0_80_52_14]